MTEASEIFELDINSLTIGEIEEIEELGGTSIDEMFSAGAKKGKALRAIAYITKRRENPEFSWEDAGNLKINLGETSPKLSPTPPAE